MLAIRLEVEQIDYEKCLENLIPQMIEKCDSRTDLSELEKLLVRLGPDAVPVMKKLLRYLDTDSRDQLLIWILEEHQEMFVSTANEQLQKMSGEAIVIGGLYGQDLPGPKIMMYATQVKIDYRKLKDSPLLSGGIIGGAAKLAIQLSKPETIEKKGISLLSSDLVKPMFLSVLSDSLQNAGLALTLGDVKLMDDPDEIVLPSPMMDPAKDEGLLPDLIEDRILDGIAAWLRDSI